MAVEEKESINEISYYLLGANWDGDDQVERFIQNGIWENGYDNKYLDIINNVKINDKVAIKSSFPNKNRESVLRIKAIGTVINNPQNGKELFVKWENDFSYFDIEGLGKYRKTIHKVSNDDIDTIFKHSIKINYKQQYTNWLNETNKEGSNKVSSYIRAIEILSEITEKEIFEEDNLSILDELYNDLLKEQRKQTEGDKYYYLETSYGTGGFYSAAINSYRNFLKELSFSENNTPKNQINMPLNQILFGPPGTGKTYNSIDRAVAIATGSSSDHQSNKEIFDELRKQGQIEFITFHQNYSYEDFMIGIRPNISDINSELNFKKFEGIFYKMTKRAIENYENSFKNKETLSREKWIKEKFNDFKDYVQDEIDQNSKYILTERVSIYGVEDNAFIFTGEKENGDFWRNRNLRMHFDALIDIHLANIEERKDIKSLENIPALEKDYATYCIAVIKKFREFLEKNNQVYQPINEQKEPLKNFVLVIDEINRANISKVFGELITLLEDDKRLGQDNELKITLPNGEKDFGIPPNLYIIGTMNTADKSISLIDIALRRRFEFVGFYPKYDKLEEDTKNLLQTINKEIYERKKSADFLIGHAYFMKNQPVETTLKNKVIPLLMEYFSGKTDIVMSIFDKTNWSVSYNTENFDWEISEK